MIFIQTDQKETKQNETEAADEDQDKNRSFHRRLRAISSLLLLSTVVQRFSVLTSTLNSFAISSYKRNDVQQVTDVRKANPSIVLETSIETSKFPTGPTRQHIYCNESGCIDPDGVIGQWFYTPNRTKLPQPGCCTRESQVHSEFSPTPINCTIEYYPPFFRGDNASSQLMRTYECLCPHFIDHYSWKSPELPEYDAVKTCQLLGSRTVLMIGDSTMRQTASYLINALFPGGCQTHITFRLADTLVDRLYGNLNRGGHWRQLIAKTRPRPDIVVLSVGPQWSGSINETLYFREVVEEVLSDIAKLKESSSKFRNITFVWKTQQPNGCSENIPLLPPAEAAHQPNVSGMRGPVLYEWDLYLLSRLQELNMPYLDLRMLYSRSDAHLAHRNDCLHFCNGPLNVIGPVFQKMLKELSS